MYKLATAAQMKRMDEAAIQDWGIPSTALMERAAGGIVQRVLELWEERVGQNLFFPQARGEVLTDRDVFSYVKNGGNGTKTAAIFAGPGNNGGDGVAAARRLRQEGWTARCFLVGQREKMTADCQEMERRLVALGGVLEEFVPDDGGQAAFVMGADVIVDAVFGVGLNTSLRQPGALAVALMNRSPAPVVSADIPSGVEADTGRVLGDAVQACVTVTFSMAKPGLFVGKGALCAGRVVVHDIGIPKDILEREAFDTILIDALLVTSWLPRRPPDGHKGDFGRVLVVGGSEGYTGAPVLAARGALRSGVGLVTVAVPESVYPIVAVKCEEAMARPILGTGELIDVGTGCDAVLIGPGMGRAPEAERLILALAERINHPVVVDADGINVLAAHMDSLDGRKGRLTVLTPHDGEFARLGGDLSGGDRLGAARAFAVGHGCVLVLKGHRTIVALPDGKCYVNATGNSGMAKGGSGDVLAGLLLSLLGQGLSVGQAAVCAVYLHGRAGDLAALDKGEMGMLPTDLVEQIPYAIKELL